MFTGTRIENAVRAALECDSRIRHPELIAISADEIGTVVLHAAVEGLPQRLAARQELEWSRGSSTWSSMTSRCIPAVGARRADDEIRAAAQQQVINDSRIRSNHVHVMVSHGWVTLTGYVRDQSERAAAVDDVTPLSGVRGVIDRIEVR